MAAAADSMPEQVGRPFKKGESGNPGGGPKWLKGVRESLKSLTPLAAKTLKDIMENTDAKDADRAKAADVVLKYTVPLPKQTHRVEGKGGDPLALMSAEALVAFVTGKKP
jgi:hypothetical protein